MIRLIWLDSDGFPHSSKYDFMDEVHDRVLRLLRNNSQPCIYGDDGVIPAMSKTAPASEVRVKFAEAVRLTNEGKASWWDLDGKRAAEIQVSLDECAPKTVATSSPARPARKSAQVPPEIWAVPIEGMDYMAAVRAMCAGAGQ